MTNQPKKNNIGYVKDLTFNKINYFLCYYSQMKILEHNIQNMICQTLKLKTITC